MEATPLGEPDGPVVMHQKWRNLLFLHWRVDAEAVRALLPEGLTVDTFDAHAWIGVVPFLMRGVRPRFLPAVPGLSSFGELNLRTYVLGPDGRPGVWFFSLDASQALAVEIARRFFRLPYFRARITTTGHIDGSLTFESLRHGADPRSACRFRWRGVGPLAAAEPGTLEHFLVERYLLYAWDDPKQRLLVGRVDHAPYRLQQAEVPVGDDALFALDDLPGIGRPDRPWDHATASPGVDVRIHPLRFAPASPG
ncbi:YqjF family protein [Phycisphaera mikurensis]|uniref:DUF2071 domain-containing protein n=1 Tax=Phycisphaera mikurensis (strain NBRC 102666 / KCTC 22515 / FYK2301M01) TaxID=1142394 RepID=I0IDL4_PHYMF|nr:DUF2071 domain-containing protein [Phycisphaera mikurensis]MBB6441171.1 hypothetical protein [Phycisphaera mikurensis]BAM03352.1 hypothetical protein PSMK_11930 [Phycisphaera mikurensis NBRC 102666]